MYTATLSAPPLSTLRSGQAGRQASGRAGTYGYYVGNRQAGGGGQHSRSHFPWGKGLIPRYGYSTLGTYLPR